jgi:hypothetical protein
MRLLITAVALCMAFASAHAQDATLLHPSETLEGASIAMGDQYEHSKLFISRAAEHVTQGAGAVGAVTRSPEDATGNVYISVYLPIEPTDFTERAIAFDAASSTPERSKALYVRGYDEFGSIVMSWQSWTGEMSSEATEFVLAPETDRQGLSWEPNRIQSEDRSAVTRLEFITGSGEKGVYFNMAVDNVRAVSVPQ